MWSSLVVVFSTECGALDVCVRVCVRACACGVGGWGVCPSVCFNPTVNPIFKSLRTVLSDLAAQRVLWLQDAVRCW